MKPVRLTGKIMEEKLKIGWTEEDFANHFQIPSESFSELVRKTFHKEHVRIISTGYTKIGS